MERAVNCFCRVIMETAKTFDVRRLRVELLDDECMIVFMEAGEPLAFKAQKHRGFAGALCIDGDELFVEGGGSSLRPALACEDLQRRLSENVARILASIRVAAHGLVP